MQAICFYILLFYIIVIALICYCYMNLKSPFFATYDL